MWYKNVNLSFVLSQCTCLTDRRTEMPSQYCVALDYIQSHGKSSFPSTTICEQNSLSPSLYFKRSISSFNVSKVGHLVTLIQ